MANTARRWPWARILLFVSLAFNLAVIGLVAGLALREGPDRRGPEAGFWRHGMAMPEPHRGEMMRLLRAERPRLEHARQQLKDSRAQLAAALTAEPFDPAAVVAVLAEERMLIGDLADRGTALLVAQVGKMTPQERQAYAEALVTPRRRDGPDPR